MSSMTEIGLMIFEKLKMREICIAGMTKNDGQILIRKAHFEGSGELKM